VADIDQPRSWLFAPGHDEKLLRKVFDVGADAVLLGRPYVYGLAVGGQAGVERVIKQMWAEVDTNLSLLGAHSVRELDRSWVTEAPR